MIVTIMQPAYLPWLGYLHRIALSDLFISLDTVRLDKGSKTGFAHRNKVRTKDGWCWLSIPLETSGRTHDLYFQELEIGKRKPWRIKHWKTWQQYYGGAKYFGDFAPRLAAFYAHEWSDLPSLANEMLGLHMAALGIATPVRPSSAMDAEGTKSELILNLCKIAGATVYLSGPFGREYLNLERFEEAGIRVVFHEYVHPIYPQAHPGFQPYMAALDLLLNCGPESRDILGRGNLTREALLTSENTGRLQGERT